MPKKMKFLSLFKKNTKFVTRSWPLPCQQQPRTLSFKVLAANNNNKDNGMLKTINSVCNIDPTTNMAQTEAIIIIQESPESIIFTDQDQSLDQCPSFSSVSSEIDSGERNVDPIIQNVIGELRGSDRIFFEHDETRSIFESKANGNSNSSYHDKNLCLPLLLKDSVALAMESKDPYVDFKDSMEEMVNAHGLKDNWEGLEELLCWYLKINGENNHGYIVSAFVDLVVGIASSSSSYHYSNNNNTSPSPSPSSSPLSFNSTFFQTSSSGSTTLCIEGNEGEGHNLKQVKEEEIITTTHNEDGASSYSPPNA